MSEENINKIREEYFKSLIYSSIEDFQKHKTKDNIEFWAEDRGDKFRRLVKITISPIKSIIYCAEYIRYGQGFKKIEKERIHVPESF